MRSSRSTVPTSTTLQGCGAFLFADLVEKSSGEISRLTPTRPVLSLRSAAFSSRVLRSPIWNGFTLTSTPNNKRLEQASQDPRLTWREVGSRGHPPIAMTQLNSLERSRAAQSLVPYATLQNYALACGD